MFYTLSRRKIIIIATFNLLSANAFSLVQSKISSFNKGLTANFVLLCHFSSCTCSNYLFTTRLLKTLRKTLCENIVVKGENAGNSIFSFSHNVLYLSQNIFQIFSLIYYTPQNSVWGVYRSQLVGQSVRRSVCSFLSALFLINYWTNFIQTSQVNSVSSRDVHMKCWLWFIDFSQSYGPFTYFAFL